MTTIAINEIVVKVNDDRDGVRSRSITANVLGSKPFVAKVN
ncbi:MAG: hypothetical protein ACRDDJ_03535 [[Mycobacterium] stephanolepidis]